MIVWKIIALLVAKADKLDTEAKLDKIGGAGENCPTLPNTKQTEGGGIDNLGKPF